MNPPASPSPASPTDVRDAPRAARRLSVAPQTLDGLSVVLPCFNEEENVEAMVEDARSAARLVSAEHEVVVVDDGSRDRTGELADALAAAHPDVRVVHHPVNRGYGAAVRSGLGAARMPWVFLTDADRQFDLAQLESFVPRTAVADVVVGRRANRADPIGRRLAAGAWNRLVRSLFSLPVRDVDCAFKLIRRDLLGAFDLSAEGAMISTELVAKCVTAGATVVELDVEHRPRPAGEQSGTNPRVVARAFRELAQMRRVLAESG